MKRKSRNIVDLSWQLIKTNFKMRYQNSVLGVLWVLIKPYATFIVLYFLWTSLRGSREDIQNYTLYLLFGIIFYTYFSEMVTLGQLSLLSKANIILKVSFPRQIAVVAALVNGLINLGINMILIILIALVSGVIPSVGGFMYFILITAMVFVFCMALAFFTSILTIRFRDLGNIFDLSLFLLYWGSSIFYLIDTTTDVGTASQLIALNPIGIVIGQARAALSIHGEINLPLMLVYFGVALIFAIGGWNFFNSRVRKVAEYF